MTKVPLIKIIENILWINARPFNKHDIETGKFVSNITQEILELNQELLSSLIVVLDTRHEGHGQLEYDLMIQELTKESWFDANKCFWINNVITVKQPRVLSAPWQMTNHMNYLDFVKRINRNWNTLDRKVKFACLMRRQTPSRTRLALDIINKFPSNQYVLSCSTEISPNFGYKEHGITFPILLDGPTTQTQSHQLDREDVFDCLINSIVETSNQLDALTQAGWSSIFITEKTFKAFAWRQIPIWFAVPGTVDAVRSAGFDVFDDICNHHDYDNITDQSLRFLKVLEYLQKLLYSLPSIDSLIPRFQYNYDLLQELNLDITSHDTYLINLVKESYQLQNSTV